MPVEINLGMPPAGYALRGARKGEETALVQVMEFTSTEDGQHFIQRLEGVPNEIICKFPTRVLPSQVDTLLAICRRDGTALIYLNEIEQRVLVRAKGPIQKGASVMKDHIADISRLELNATIPDDAGVLFLFSVGWRKGLFYDFAPLGTPSAEPRKYDLGAILGQSYCQVLFQERFSMSDAEWDALLASKWFLFAGLKHETIDGLIAYIRAGWDPDEKMDEIANEMKLRLPEMLASWKRHTSFTPHCEILDRAVERFQNDDFVSCTGLLFPRIEGILRTHHSSLGLAAKPSQDNLPETAVASKIGNKMCLLLPHRFERYLRDVYFANFNPVAQNIDISRNSVAHGVASVAEFNRKSAIIGLLVVHQLFYFLDAPTDSPTQPTTIQVT